MATRGYVDQDERTRLVVALNMPRPTHGWAPFSDRPGCTRCPASSPFHFDRVAHVYVIQEEP